MNRSHLEIEAKFDVDPSFGLPSLDGLPGVCQVDPPTESSLQATYYDTTSLRLARAGITLRRRAGGDDAGWHLKLPVAVGERTEVQFPFGRSRRENAPVPAALLREIRAYVRDADLVPVARVQTERTVHRLRGRAGVPLVDIADDHVTGQAMGHEVTVWTWREVEVELIDGDRDLLAAVGRRLRLAGAQPALATSKLARTLGDRLPGDTPGDHRANPADRVGPAEPAGAVVQVYLAEHVTALIAADAGVRAGTPEAVHQMRVATRRLRSVLATYRPLFDRAVTEPLRAELKHLGGVLGGLRDSDVMQERLLAGVAALPGDLVLGPVRSRVRRELQAQRRQARRLLMAELDGPRYFRLLDALDGLAAAPPFTDQARGKAARVLPRRVAREWTRLRDRQAAAESAATAEDRELALHETRKAAKRARYAAEAATPIAGRPARRYVQRMTKLQTSLGGYQDSTVSRQLLRTIGVQAYLAGENGFTFGLLHGLEARQAQDAGHKYRRAWHKATRPRVHRWLG